MKRILITGAANGLGCALLEAAAADGNDVVGLDREEPGARTPRTGFIRCDLRRIDEIRAAVAALCADRGPPYLIINNAAIGAVAPLEHLDAAAIADCIAVNLAAPLLLARELLPQMRKRGGRIVNISSLSSTISVPGTAAYAASKAGLERASCVLAAELVGSGVSVGLVRLGRLRTEGYVATSRRLAQHLVAGAFRGYEPIEAVLWGVVGAEEPRLAPAAAARAILRFAWTGRRRLTIAPPRERLQALAARQLPPVVINRLLGFSGRRARPI